METLSGLIDAVDRLLDTSCFDKQDVVKMLNRQQLLIAGGGERSYGIPQLPPLPGLQTSFQVRVFQGRNDAILPSSYHRGDGDLVWIESTGEQVCTVDRVKEFYRKNSGSIGRTGNIEECCLAGGKIYYVNSPAVDTDLKFYGYRYPVDMVDDDDSPDGIPAHLQYPLLVNGSVYIYWSFLDQDVEKPLHNIEKHRFYFQQALTDLQVWIQDHDGAYNMESDIDNFQ